MTYRFARLTAADLESFRDLMVVFADAFEDMASYQSRKPGADYLASFLKQDSHIVIVAFSGDDVIGGLVAYVLDKFEQERREIYIYDLAVAATHRRRGVATALIDELRSIARSCGAHVIFVQGDPGDDPALALYDKLGAREAVFHFDIEPAPGG